MRPNKKQEDAIFSALRATRILYNQSLEELINYYRETGKYLNRFAHDKLHNKARHPDLPAVLVDTTLDRIHRSFANFFRGRREDLNIGFPRFKSANRWHSIQFRDSGPCLKGNYFRAPKLCGGKIRVNVHRPLEGEFKFARIVKRPSGWYLQCVCEVETKPLPKTGKEVGLDMGITYLVTDSDGRKIDNPKYLKTSLELLAKAQRELSRKQKGGKRYRKAAKKVARIHEHISNQRKDTLHKISRYYVDNYQVIAIEDLKPCNMVKNRFLAMAIMDAAWGILRNQLTYKAESAGRELVAVNPRYTSQKCSKCSEMVKKSLSVRTHFCPCCGIVECRDINAAKNVLLLARTGPSLTTRKAVPL